MKKNFGDDICHIFGSIAVLPMVFCDQEKLDMKLLVKPQSRALCRTKLLPVTHVLVDTWMLTVKPVYKL